MGSAFSVESGRQSHGPLAQHGIVDGGEGLPELPALVLAVECDDAQDDDEAAQHGDDLHAAHVLVGVADLLRGGK